MIIAKKLGVEFPIYGTKSFKKTLLSGIPGGIVTVSDNTVIVTALHDINFEFTEGERIGLWGHNGSGKTTLLRTLAGVYFPTSGSLQVNGAITSFLNISLGNEFEASGMDNIYLRAAIMGLSKVATKNIVDDVVEFAGLEDFIHLPLRTYSSGMLMRLNFAVATSIHSDIVLMDEWLSVGDEDFAAKAQKRLKSLLDNSKLLIIASHNKDTLAKNCTRVISLEKGQVVRDEPTTASKASIQDLSW